MVVLDTDHVTFLERATSPEGVRLRARLKPLAESDKTTSIVCFEEQTRGWLAVIAKARTQLQFIESYRRLKQHLLNYCGIRVLDFDEHSAAEFQSLHKMRLGIGTLDLRIAATALAHHATLLSRNLRDFRKVPGLQVEDWTI